MKKFFCAFATLALLAATPSSANDLPPALGLMLAHPDPMPSPGQAAELVDIIDRCVRQTYSAKEIAQIRQHPQSVTSVIQTRIPELKGCIDEWIGQVNEDPSSNSTLPGFATIP